MISRDEYQRAQKIVKDYEQQELNKKILPRYFVDIRGGCGAVRDKWHSTYDEDYYGLHSDTPDVISYKHGYSENGVWNMREDDVEYLNELCILLNKNIYEKNIY